MAYRLGGSFVRTFLDMLVHAVSATSKYVSIDSRAHMLMPKMYPCIPGWHCDDFYRPKRTKGQPDLRAVLQEAPASHYCMVLDAGTGSLTRFATSEIDAPTFEDGVCDGGETLYGVAHDVIEKQKISSYLIKSGEVVRFSPLSWHRGEPAIAAGWRYFIRLTESNHHEPLNELRTQTQVYLTEPFAGW